MWLTNAAVRRPVFIVMFWSALIVLGLRARLDMKIERNPKVDVPVVTVTTVYPGAGPEEIETLVTKPIEEAVSGVNNIDDVTSISADSLSTVAIEFTVGTDSDVVSADIREKVDAILRRLPADADRPTISKLDINAMPVLMLGVSSKLPLSKLQQLADDVIKDRFGKVPGVASVALTGGEVREIRVALDRGRLDALGVTVSDVAHKLAAQNLNLPSGDVDEGKLQFSVRTLGEFESVEQIRNLRLQFGESGGPKGEGTVVTLGDLGRVLDTVAKPDEITRVQRKQSVGIMVLKANDANTVEVCDGVKDELERLRVEYPDLEFVISQDDSKDVRAALEDVNMSLILAIILVVCTVYLFLHNVRGTFIVAIAIPTSLMATFLPMAAFGFTLNQMTMLALSLVVGILVDDSIVVIENIFRHLQRGEGPRDAAINGRTEIGLAAIAITLTDVVVFVPVAFMGGIVGQFFRQFGITVAVATLFSLFVSFTLTPMLAARWFRRGEQTEPNTWFARAFDRFYGWLDSRYHGVLRWALRWRLVTMVLGVGALLFTLRVFGPRLGFEFIPYSDAGQIGITVEMPQGTTLRETDALLTRIEQVVTDEIPELKNLFTNAGRITGGFHGAGDQGPIYGQVMVYLTDRVQLMERVQHPFEKFEGRRVRSDREIARQLRALMKTVPGADIRVSVAGGFGGTEAPVQIELRGNNMDQLIGTANRIRDYLDQTEGMLSPDISWRTGKPEVQVRVDREKAADFDFSVAQIAMILRDALEGNTDSVFREDGEEYDIRVQLEEFDRDDVREVADLLIGLRNHRPVRLRDVATIRVARGPNKIDRKNRQRQVTVRAQLAEGYPLGNMRREVDPKIRKLVPKGVLLHWGGQAEISQESNQHMMTALMLAVVLVYMLMAALFESFLNPFIIMFSLPMALVGAVAAMVLTGKTMSIIAMIGIIMLMGLVTKNAILLIDYTNTLRARGAERNAALLEAGPARLRPILMTTASMVFGMLPIAIGFGEASEVRAPMGIVVIGGLLVSTLLTLVIIPVMYTLMDDLTNLLGRTKRGLVGLFRRRK